MNDLEFRRQAYADPKNQDPEFLQSVAESQERQEFVDELKMFDQQLEQALDIPVPEGLADEIILGQSFAEERRNKRQARVHLALAASVAFVAGVSLTLLRGLPSQPELSQIALAHQYEDALLTQIDEQLTVSQANAKLAAYGGQLQGDIGHIYAANFCNLDGIRGVHLVVAGTQGKVSIFLIPPQGDRPMQTRFADSRYDGMIERYPDGEVVIIGEQGEALDQWQRKLDENLQWGAI